MLRVDYCSFEEGSELLRLVREMQDTLILARNSHKSGIGEFSKLAGKLEIRSMHIVVECRRLLASEASLTPRARENIAILFQRAVATTQHRCAEKAGVIQAYLEEVDHMDAAQSDPEKHKLHLHAA